MACFKCKKHFQSQWLFWIKCFFCIYDWEKCCKFFILNAWFITAVFRIFLYVSLIIIVFIAEDKKIKAWCFFDDHSLPFIWVSHACFKNICIPIAIHTASRSHLIVLYLAIRIKLMFYIKKDFTVKKTSNKDCKGIRHLPQSFILLIPKYLQPDPFVRCKTLTIWSGRIHSSIFFLSILMVMLSLELTRPKYVFNKCGANIYFFTLQRFGSSPSPSGRYIIRGVVEV